MWGGHMGDFFDTAYVILMHGSVKRPLICSRSIDIGQLRLDLKVKRRLNRFELVAFKTRSNLPLYRQLHFLSLTNPPIHASTHSLAHFLPHFFSHSTHPLTCPLTHSPACAFSLAFSHTLDMSSALFSARFFTPCHALFHSLSLTFSLCIIVYVSRIHSLSLSLSRSAYFSLVIPFSISLSFFLSLSLYLPHSLLVSFCLALLLSPPSLPLSHSLLLSPSRARALSRCCQALRFGGMMCPKALRVGDLPGMEILHDIINMYILTP